MGGCAFRFASAEIAHRWKLASGVPESVVRSALKRRPKSGLAANGKALLAWYRHHDAEWQKLNAIVALHAKKEPQPKLVKVMVCSEGVTPIRHHTQGADFFNETFFLKRGRLRSEDGEGGAGLFAGADDGSAAGRTLASRAAGGMQDELSPPFAGELDYGHGTRRGAFAGPRDRQSAVAASFWPRHCCHAERLWRARQPANASGTARLAGSRADSRGLAAEADSQADDDVGDVYAERPDSMRPMPKSIPENDLACGGSTPQRLEAEVIRDSMLAVSGTLDPTLYGPGTLDEGHTRRSIYFMVKRSKLVPMMQLFDQPEPLVSVGGRPSTTIAPQALAFLNSPHVRGYAHAFAKRLQPEYEKSPASAVKQGYLMAIGRAPDNSELAATLNFVAAQEKSYAASEKPDARELAVADFCQVLFGLNEFVYVE